MQKTGIKRPLLIGIIVGVLLLLVLMLTTPREIDWSLSFSNRDKTPFGNTILFEQLPSAFPGHPLLTCHTPFKDFNGFPAADRANYVIISDKYMADSTEACHMLSFVERGNSVFIAAGDFSKFLMDSLKLEITHQFWHDLVSPDSTMLNFANRRIKTPYGYFFKKCILNFHFTDYDSTRTTVLGYNQQARTNFIKIRHGEGSLLLHVSPIVFTNYGLLQKDNYEYLFKCLSYLPVEPTIWDEYYKPGINQNRSVLEFILKNDSLRIAWYLLLIGVILFMVFESKRRQRMIPVVNPPENSSLRFIETIGRLYFNKKNHLDLAKKKFTYFVDFVRSRYYQNMQTINEEGISELSAKSEIPEKNITQIIRMAQRINQSDSISEDDLISFNQKIEFFYKNCK